MGATIEAQKIQIQKLEASKDLGEGKSSSEASKEEGLVLHWSHGESLPSTIEEEERDPEHHQIGLYLLSFIHHYGSRIVMIEEQKEGVPAVNHTYAELYSFIQGLIQHLQQTLPERATIVVSTSECASFQYVTQIYVVMNLNARII